MFDIEAKDKSDLPHRASFRTLAERAGILRERLKCETKVLEEEDDTSGFAASERQEDREDESDLRSLAEKGFIKMSIN